MKRTITIILTIILVLSNINFIAYASDNYDEQYYREAIMLLETLKIKDDVSSGTLTGESISRIDFLKLVIKAITNNANLTDVSYKTGYTDVGSDSWAVGFAVSTGLISNGYKFYPDKDADLSYAKAVINSAAAYEFKDGQYSQMPVKEGLTERLRPESATYFSVGDAYVMIYNLLCAEKLEKNGSAYKLSGRTLLSDMYDIELIKGRMVADFESSLYGENISPYTVKIEGNDGELSLYYDGETEDLLGRNVKAYYKEDEAVLIIPRYNDDIILEIAANEYDQYDNVSRKLYYKVYEASNRWESSIKIKYEYLPQNMDIIHNGRFTEEHSKIYSVLKNADGYDIDSLTLIDNDRNGKADLMKINTYKTVTVTTPDEDNFTVNDKTTGKLIDLDGANGHTEVVVFNQAGDEIAFGKIPNKSVISIFENSSDPQKMKLIVSTTVVAGMVNKVTEDTIVIDGEEYSLSQSFVSYRNKLNAGVSYTFYLDHNYKICSFDVGADKTRNLGGVIKIGEDDADKSILFFSIYTVDGETIRLETAEKWRVNGSNVYMSDNKLVYNKEDGTQAVVIDELKTAFIQYKLSSTGKIREIRTAKKNAGVDELGYTAGMNNPESVFYSPSTHILTYKNNGKFFMPSMGSESSFNFIAVGNDTKVIKMPSANITSGRERYFGTGVKFSNDYDVPVVGYTLQGSNNATADVIVVVNDSASDPSDSSYYVVKKKSIALNNNEEVGYKLDLYNRLGSELSITTEECDFPEYSETKGMMTGESLDIEPGDIIKYGVNSEGDATAFVMVYDANGDKVATQNPDKWYVGRRVVEGSIYSTEGNVFTYVTQKEMPENVDGKLQVGYAPAVILVAPNVGLKGYIKAGTVSDMVSYLEDSYNYSNIVYISGYGETTIVVAYMK